MKIAFVAPSMGFGGAERVISILANSFIKNHEVYILLTSKSSEISYKLDEKVQVINVFENSIIKTWMKLRKVCKQQKIDVALAFMSTIGIFAALFLAFTKTKVIASERNDPSAKDRQNGLAVRMMEIVSRHFTDWYVFQSEGAKKYYSKTCQKKSSVILNPLDVDKLPIRCIDEVDNRIVSVGRLQPQKNHKMLIEAFSKSEAVDTHTLHIYGEGNLRTDLEKQIAELGLEGKVFLEGNSKTVHEDIKNAKLFAFTSDYEGLPNALIEAMAMGIPSISTDCSPGGARMLIDDGINGRLIECGNVSEFSKALDDTLCDNKKLSMYGNNGTKIRDIVETEKIASQWLDIIRKIV